MGDWLRLDAELLEGDRGRGGRGGGEELQRRGEEQVGRAGWEKPLKVESREEGPHAGREAGGGEKGGQGASERLCR